MAGTLFIVATPIGNLEDLTFRALRTLREVDLIAAEDTRRTARLLAHYEIKRPVLSLREHNEIRLIPKLLGQLSRGTAIALVSDAGTPGISDPGARLVRSASEHGIRVVPIPGPSAVAAALSASGFPADQFAFLGFPPRTGQARVKWLEKLANTPETVVFFEAPHRIRRTLDEVATCVGERHIIYAREISKIHEEFVVKHKTSKPPTELGEFTIVVSADESLIKRRHHIDNKVVNLLFGCLTDSCGYEFGLAVDTLALAFHTAPSAIIKIVRKDKYLAKQHTYDGLLDHD